MGCDVGHGCGTFSGVTIGTQRVTVTGGGGGRRGVRGLAGTCTGKYRPFACPSHWTSYRAMDSDQTPASSGGLRQAPPFGSPILGI